MGMTAHPPHICCGVVMLFGVCFWCLHHVLQLTGVAVEEQK